VLGIDPGLVDTGYGVLEPGPHGISVLVCGVVGTRAEAPLEARLALVYDAVVGLLDAHAPALLVLEDLYTEYRFPRTAILMAHARGVICLAARQRDVTVLTLAPAAVKRAIAASGAASKEQIQHAVQSLLGLERLPRPSHVADALALALTGLSRAGATIGNGRPFTRQPVDGETAPGAPPAPRPGHPVEGGAQPRAPRPGHPRFKPSKRLL
jgi:crossover junction endodeoxyribonuclease RuvC